MNRKKNLLLLTAVFLLASILCGLLVSCGNKNGDGTETTVSADSDLTEAPEEQTTILDTLPTGNYTGKNFSIYTTTHNWAVSEILSDEITGDEVRDEQYSRTEMVKKRLGDIQFDEITGGEDVIQKKLESQVLGDTNEFNMMTLSTARAYSAAIKNQVTDIATLPGINLEMPWWAQKYNESVNLAGKYYIAFGDISLVYHGAFYILMFNSAIIDDLKLENPFDLVENGQWTWEKMYQMMIATAKDNGNGTVEADQDIFGLSGHRVHFKHFMVTANAFLCENDDSGLPQYKGASDRFVTAYMDLVNKFIANDQLVTIDGVSKSLSGLAASVSGQGYYRDVFKQGRCLFLTEGTGSLYMHKDSGIGYGIVPFPMFEGGYDPATINTAVYSATTGPIVPINQRDEDFVGAVIECMCGYSHDTSREVFVESTLSYRYVNDAPSLAMVRRILDNGVVDRAFAFGFGNLPTTFDGALQAKSTNITSALGMLKKTIEGQIDEYITAFAG